MRRLRGDFARWLLVTVLVGIAVVGWYALMSLWVEAWSHAIPQVYLTSGAWPGARGRRAAESILLALATSCGRNAPRTLIHSLAQAIRDTIRPSLFCFLCRSTALPLSSLV